MKKIVSIVLILILAFSLYSISAFADGEIIKMLKENEEYFKQYRENTFGKIDDDNLTMLALNAIMELADRKILDEQACINAINALDRTAQQGETKSTAPAQTEYDFGQGTFVVGQDLAAGTYDVTCTSTNDSSYSDSMNAFSDFASSYGMEEYANLFDSYGSLATSLDSMSIIVYKANGIYDNSYTIKPDGSARIIVTDGMKIEITGGNAHLTWIR